jgi:hypothetical protein|tara:strand:- start:106 stop:1089 length:984 start_codon:yes stop_codon:yes gene_type:complete
VQIALTLSLLDKEEEEALFWAYELYDSGFINDVFATLWHAYYDFYASSNFYLEQYFLNKWKEFGNSVQMIKVIICNLIIKPFTLDVFLVRPKEVFLEESMNFTNSEFTLFNVLFHEIIKSDYECVMKTLYNNFYFELTKEKINLKKFMNTKHHVINEHIICISRVFLCFMLKGNNKSKGHKCYLSTEHLIKEKDIVNISPSNILKNFSRFSLFSNEFMSLFSINYESDLQTAYLMNWVYCSFKCPLWKGRIESHKGKINHAEKSIDFANDDELEAFYELYGLEPDEQCNDITECRVKPEMHINHNEECKSFVEQYNCDGFIKSNAYE